MANGSITSPKGFEAAGIRAGVKISGKPDLGLVFCADGATAAAVFTTNKICSPAVTVSRQHLKSKYIYAAVINSGNANTCTGTQGFKDAVTMCQRVARQIQVDPHEVLVASTGIIGHKLPMSKINHGIYDALDTLSPSIKAGHDFARAIMTTDTRPKEAVRKLTISGQEVTLAGTAKGAGMIGPNMATTICVITTDVVINKALLQRALREAIGQSLNRLTIDGHQSTNDTAILLASGESRNSVITHQCPRYRMFVNALKDLTTDLARQMALDAEGAKRMFTVRVTGAKTQAQAFKAARAVADYDLVKCAVHGGDPNWGRIICAVGSCGVDLNPDRLSCKIGNVLVFKDGQPTRFNQDKAVRTIKAKEHTIEVDLGIGKASDFCIGCDLSQDYITINADYHT